ncbi:MULTISPECIES: DUF2933 domain-containing protein [Rhizobium/Agrobacterium group]|jgi:hypothetical protein|uniref:DUF2933 domain-containing protein n=1 Tax=Rhizobium/Agrobacterium group TaxID=227290 RepID=UPI001E31EFCB|nr:MULTISPECIES: DUF2933 domain-containing protein [Rhizobium/Agrobacterium group]MCF1450466.1 DUF2933 domain-containing protein [Allorhizobium ampelinum]CAH0343549.1 hypothetical protein RHI9324_05286 [Rhizobium sp. CECT 9324]
MKWDRRWTLIAASLGVIVAFFVLREHWAHALGLAPYIILLACPLLHLFHGHGGHGHGGHGEDRLRKDETR